MRGLLIVCPLLFAACASAGQGGSGDLGDDQGGDDGPGPGTDGGDTDTPCNDVDNDGACQAVDECPGADDRLDADSDTVPDGCDQCPGADDTVDANSNSTPDCSELGPSQTRTIPLKIVGGTPWRGRHGTQLSNSVPGNTFTGEASSVGTLNGYFVFTLDGFTPVVVESVKLRLDLVIYADTYGATETISVWDVTTPAATVQSTTTLAPAIVTDLQSGTKFGEVTVSAANVGMVVEIPLNASANTDVKAKIGQDFVVGMHTDTVPGYVLFSNNTENRTHELVVTFR